MTKAEAVAMMLEQRELVGDFSPRAADSAAVPEMFGILRRFVMVMEMKLPAG